MFVLLDKPLFYIMAFTPARSSDNYIQFKRTITNKDIIKIVKTICEESLLSENEVVYLFITQSAKIEIEKRKRFEDFKSKK